LELAGSDACVVHEDADLDEAAINIVNGRFIASGQVCISIKRLIVHASVHDQLIERIMFHVRNLKVGLPSDPATDIIPLGHQKTLSMIGSAIEDAVLKGGIMQCGGYRVNYQGEKDINGPYFAPTVITNVNYKDDIMQNEILGPVLPVTKYDTIDEAIKIANSSKFGLRASIWTKNKGVADRFIDEVDVGSVLVNKFHLWFGDDVAHLGGMKASSGTNNGAKYFIEEMLKKKYVNKESMINLR
jgi:lactaldehyde dehydrogenase